MSSPPDPLGVFRLHDFEVVCLTFTSDNEFLFSGFVGVLQNRSARARARAFTRTNARRATSDVTGCVIQWKLVTRRALWKRQLHRRGVLSLLVNDANDTLISYGRDGFVHFWSMAAMSDVQSDASDPANREMVPLRSIETGLRRRTRSGGLSSAHRTCETRALATTKTVAHFVASVCSTICWRARTRSTKAQFACTR